MKEEDTAAFHVDRWAQALKLARRLTDPTDIADILAEAHEHAETALELERQRRGRGEKVDSAQVNSLRGGWDGISTRKGPL